MKHIPNQSEMLLVPAASRQLIPCRIHFDGGTSCNIPRLGYGAGYGSYQVDSNPVVRIEHQVNCSANAAEILTLCCALESLCDRPGLWLKVFGDSQIAIKWMNICCGNMLAKKQNDKNPHGSVEFVEAIQRLRNCARGFGRVEAAWLPRAHAVAAFGH